MYTFDLHLKGSTVKDALYNLEIAIKLAKKSKERILCLIVGYGSSGGSHKIKSMVIEALDELVKCNKVKEFICGNELDLFNEKFLKLKLAHLIPDICKKRRNPGEIIVIL